MGKPVNPMSSSRTQAIQEINRLTILKENIEAEMEGHRGRLEAEQSTMTSSLLTLDGFPRDDIDILAVRHARVRLLELRNDLKSIMNQIEEALHQALPPPSSPPPASSSSTPMDVDASSSSQPFALVKSVDEKGPAGAAGLQPQDQIVLFGKVDASNHDNLKALAALVGASEGSPISIQVLRDGQVKTLSMVPRSGWGGRGLIGTHIVPV
ncbi:putative 26S proteasome non-ATPase regulatory subunit 9 [Mrakia frigida]|uniref:Nas2p n=1 Tax=Mrakia frigida TaxID=29902 RepID=UPI003FCC17F5